MAPLPFLKFPDLDRAGPAGSAMITGAARVTSSASPGAPRIATDVSTPAAVAATVLGALVPALLGLTAVLRRDVV